MANKKKNKKNRNNRGRRTVRVPQIDSGLTGQMQRKENIPYDRSIKLEGLLNLGFLLLWLLSYLGCDEVIIYAYNTLSWPSDYSLIDETVGMCRAALNFIIAVVVVTYTYCDRNKLFKDRASKVQMQYLGLSKINSVFMPLGLAIVPFTSAATDLGKAMGEPSLTFTLILFFLLSITSLETYFVFRFEKKYHVDSVVNWHAISVLFLLCLILVSLFYSY